MNVSTIIAILSAIVGVLTILLPLLEQLINLFAPK